jgi:anti-sigma-K factor RskA
VAALTPLPLVAAGEAGTPAAKPQTLKAAVQTAAARNASVVSAPRAKDTRKAEQASTAKQSTGFFRSGVGAVALAVMAVGTGYAIYSASHDKITSPAKK